MNSPRIRSTDMADDSKELIILRKRFENHLETYRLDSVDHAERELRQDNLQESNMQQIDKLTKAVQPLVDGITVLVVIQKLVKWLSGFAFIGIAISWFTGINPFK